VREGEGGRTALRFISIRAREGDTRRRMAWWRAGRGGGGSGILRKKKEGVGWAMGWSGRVGRMPLGPARRENNKESGLAARMTGPKLKIGFGFDFSNFISRI
jgi:hypothetical protein